MLNLFNKKSRVKEGKQTQPDATTTTTTQKKKESPMVALHGAWKKLNSMDRKQAYTWGAVVLVAFIGLLILFSAAGSDQDDFSDFETRGYDLANMPFSSDEAEQYLLANKYPDMKEGTEGIGLYSEEEKEARQAEDAENEDLEEVSSTSSNYREGRYYGGARGRSGNTARTKVGSLSSASVKGASGSGISGKFGPGGDFSNFRSQNKGNDKAPVKGPGTGNARTALRQTAMASRAAAGLKNDKLLNAKKALMGGTVDGSKAFMDDSGAVSLGDAKGLDLDTNAPVSSGDLSGLDQSLQDARDDAAGDAGDDEENSWKEFFKELGQEIIKSLVQGAINMGMNLAQNSTMQAIQDARAIASADHLSTVDAVNQENSLRMQIENPPEGADVSALKQQYHDTFHQDYNPETPAATVDNFKTNYNPAWETNHALNQNNVVNNRTTTMGATNNPPQGQTRTYGGIQQIFCNGYWKDGTSCL